MQAMIEATKVAIIAVREVKTQASTTRPPPAMPKMDVPMLKHPTFKWKSRDKHINFIILKLK